MYVHLGDDLLVLAKDIIAILDKESARSSSMVEEFLKRQEGKTVNLSKGAFKSVVVTLDQVYLSPLASGTLKKRSSQMSIQD